MKNIIQLKQKSNDQLKNRLREIDISLRKLKGFNRAGRVSENPRNNPCFMFKLRKDKARILTILRERQIIADKKLTVTDEKKGKP